MDYEHPFVQEVRANPSDDFPRLIFADYLEEAGDPRGELIRVQVALANLPPGEPDRRELELREDELLHEFAEQWLEPLRALGAEGLSERCFRRGLIERVKIKAGIWLRHGVELCRLAPALHCLEWRGTAADLPALLASEPPEQITSLDLSANRLERLVTPGFVSSLWPERLHTLSLAFNEFHTHDMFLLASRRWPKLTCLNLSMNKLAATNVARTIELWADPFHALEELSLAGNPLKRAGLRQWFSTLRPPALRSLDLATTGIDASAMEWLVRNVPLDRLEKMILRGNRLSNRPENASVAIDLELASLAERAPLRELDIRSTGCVPQTTLIERLGTGLKH